MEGEQVYSFRARGETETKARVSLGKPLFSHEIRLPSTTNTIPTPESRQLSALGPHSKQHDNTINMGDSWKPRFGTALNEALYSEIWEIHGNPDLVLL